MKLISAYHLFFPYALSIGSFNMRTKNFIPWG